MDYNALHANRAAELLPLNGKKVLVVGANTGGDCKYFVDFGCAEVHGLDVIPEIGSDYQHPRVTYHRMSAEKMDLPDDQFDLVYCFATMEHVPQIAPAFREIARVTKPGGFVYSVAAPLWNSRFGHHKSDLFGSFPWIHLRLSKEEIIEYCNRNGITAPGGISLHVEYMLNPEYFNKMPASAYIEACASLPGMNIIRNDSDLEEKNEELAAALRELEPKGYNETELRAVTHVYVAQKSSPQAEYAAVSGKIRMLARMLDLLPARLKRAIHKASGLTR